MAIATNIPMISVGSNGWNFTSTRLAAPYMQADKPLFGLVAESSVVRRPNKDDPTAKRLIIIGQDESLGLVRAVEEMATSDQSLGLYSALVVGPS